VRTRIVISYVSLALISLALIAGCGSQHAVVPMTVGSSTAAQTGLGPDVSQNRTSTRNWKQFAPKTASTIYRGIDAGPDNNIWFSDQNNLNRITMAGALHEFPLTFTEHGVTYGFGPLWLTVGADAKFYLGCGNCLDPTSGGGIIGVAKTNGSLAIHEIPSKDTLGGNGLGLGPDGNVWFAETSHIARITTGGVITEFAYPSGETKNTGSVPVTGPDGIVWFTEYFAHMVAKIDPATGVITEYDVSGLCNGPQGTAVGSDGRLYFFCTSGSLASISTDGVLVPAIANPYGTPLTPGDIIQGPNKHIWFATGTTTFGEYNENSGVLTAHTPPFNVGAVLALTDGPDGNIWGTNNAGLIDVYILATLTVSPRSLTFSGVGQTQALTASYAGPSVLSATSASPTIATVAPGQQDNTFVVTSQGVGKTTVTIQDAIGNLFKVRVTVQ